MTATATAPAEQLGARVTVNTLAKTVARDHGLSKIAALDAIRTALESGTGVPALSSPSKVLTGAEAARILATITEQRTPAEPDPRKEVTVEEPTPEPATEPAPAQPAERPLVRYLSRPEVAERIGVKADTLNRYKLPEPDAQIGARQLGWLPETIDEWNATRPGVVGRPRTRPAVKEAAVKRAAETRARNKEAGSASGGTE